MARESVRDWLQRAECVFSADAAVLVAGELVTYALIRARREVTLSIVEQRGRLHLEAQSDPSTRGPALVMRGGAPSPSDGLPGIRSVDGVWGAHSVVDARGVASDVIWFELAALADGRGMLRPGGG